MSQENVELVRQIYEHVSLHLQTPREFLGPNAQVDASDVAPESDWPRGFEATEQVLREYWETFDDFHIEVEDVMHADDEQVVTAVRDGGRIKGSSADVWNRFFHVWTIADGKVVGLSIHTDRGRALEAAGLAE